MARPWWGGQAPLNSPEICFICWLLLRKNLNLAGKQVLVCSTNRRCFGQIVPLCRLNGGGYIRWLTGCNSASFWTLCPDVQTVCCVSGFLRGENVIESVLRGGQQSCDQYQKIINVLRKWTELFVQPDYHGSMTLVTMGQSPAKLNNKSLCTSWMYLF